MINWKNPNVELPENGEYVAVLFYHWKECWPLSVEIRFGEARNWIDDEGNKTIVIENDDFSGHLERWEFGGNTCETPKSWCYAKEFQRPEFLKHDNHWGSEKF